MGEYMADAATSGEKLGTVIGNFAQVALPVLAIATAMQTVTAAIAEGKEHQEALADETERLGEALDQAGDSAVNFAQGVAEGSTELNKNVQVLKDHGDIWEFAAGQVARNVPIIGQAFQALVDDGVDVNKVLDDVGISAGDLGLAVAGTWEDWRRFKDGVDAARESGAISEREYAALMKRVTELSSALETNRLAHQAMLPFLTKQAIAEQKLAVQEKARAEKLDAYNEAQQRATDGTQAYADALSSVDYRTADLDAAVTAIGKYNDEAFALANIAQSIEESYATLGRHPVEADRGRGEADQADRGHHHRGRPEAAGRDRGGRRRRRLEVRRGVRQGGRVGPPVPTDGRPHRRRDVGAVAYRARSHRRRSRPACATNWI